MVNNLDPRLASDANDGVLRIEFAAPGALARRVVSRSNMRPTGRFPSFRMRRSMCWDSPAELNWLRLLDADPNILEFREQPCTIYYRLDGIEHRHVPDTLVRTTDGSAFWEVKAAEDAARADVATRTALLAAHCPAHGYQYRVAIAEDLRREPRLRNVRLLLRHGRSPITFEQRELCRRLFPRDQAYSWQSIVDGLHEPLTISVASRLVLEGTLTLDVDRELSSQPVRVAGSLSPRELRR